MIPANLIIIQRVQLLVDEVIFSCNLWKNMTQKAIILQTIYAPTREKEKPRLFFVYLFVHNTLNTLEPNYCYLSVSNSV